MGGSTTTGTVQAITLTLCLGVWHHATALPDLASPRRGINLEGRGQGQHRGYGGFLDYNHNGNHATAPSSIFSPSFFPRPSRNTGPDSLFRYISAKKQGHALLPRQDSKVFQAAAYHFFLRLLCPRQVKEAEDTVMFKTANFAADLDTNANFVWDELEGDSLFDTVLLNPDDWLKEVTWRYKESYGAAFVMFDLLDTDSSGFISRHDFVDGRVDSDGDGRVTVCEGMDYVNRIARQAELLLSILQKQGFLDPNSLQGPSLVPPPFLPPPVGNVVSPRPTHRYVTANDVIKGRVVTGRDNTISDNADFAGLDATTTSGSVTGDGVMTNASDVINTDVTTLGQNVGGRVADVDMGERMHGSLGTGGNEREQAAKENETSSVSQPTLTTKVVSNNSPRFEESDINRNTPSNRNRNRLELTTIDLGSKSSPEVVTVGFSTDPTPQPTPTGRAQQEDTPDQTEQEMTSVSSGPPRPTETRATMEQEFTTISPGLPRPRTATPTTNLGIIIKGLFKIQG